MIPEYMRDSVASYSKALNWPDPETRYTGAGPCRSLPITQAEAPPDPKRVRVTHDIGRITNKGGRPATKAASSCDHSQHPFYEHDKYRRHCKGCGQKYNKSGAAA